MIKSIKDFINPYKAYYTIFNRFGEYKKSNLNFFPWSIEIHPTSKCNFKCVHCSYKKRNENKISLSQKCMAKLIDSIIRINVKGVYFSGGGEPLTFPNIEQHIKRLNDNGVEVALITNGSLVRKKDLGIISLLNYIAVSIPSCNSSLYKEITSNDCFEDVINLPDYIKTKNSSTIVGLRVVISTYNYKTIFEMLSTLQQKNFDYAFFKVIRDYEGNGYGLSSNEIAELKKMIEIRASEINPDYTNLLNIFEFSKEYSGNKCWANEFRLLCNIHSNGDVYLCIPQIGNPEYSIGNLNENSLEELWNSFKHEEVICKLNSLYEMGNCKNCRAIAYNRIINELIVKVPNMEDPFI